MKNAYLKAIPFFCPAQYTETKKNVTTQYLIGSISIIKISLMLDENLFAGVNSHIYYTIIVMVDRLYTALL